ncbi:hypothetical protein NUW54_g8933 [Trametes sanguinea]|uniref:Uncharacterized protein n=1 Tax=Trametes sanguinea TaxID=158606 RepID=A0ACC1P9T0_9APHY|nr:hypothetical protein NUW54_g8933 [Trametes sanguinea]
MVGALSQLVNRNLVEDYECHLPPHLPTYDHVPNIVWAFPNLRRFTLGPVRVINEAFSDILASQSGIRTLQELVFCIAEVDQPLIAMLSKCKKLRLKHGKSVLPAKLILRLPRHPCLLQRDQGEDLLTPHQPNAHRSVGGRLSRLWLLPSSAREVDEASSLGSVDHPGRPQPRLTPNDAEWWDFTP